VGKTSELTRSDPTPFACSDEELLQQIAERKKLMGLPQEMSSNEINECNSKSATYFDNN
jgi:hypothetical protein